MGFDARVGTRCGSMTDSIEIEDIRTGEGNGVRGQVDEARQDRALVIHGDFQCWRSLSHRGEAVADSDDKSRQEHDC